MRSNSGKTVTGVLGCEISKILPREFYLRDAAEVAPHLLGKILVHDTPAGQISGAIVETEAYLSQDDPGCHAARGETKRNACMFNTGGMAYVYRIYGLYHCFNVVTGREGRGEAVLIRALAPREGVPLMARNRGRRDLLSLCSGPGKLCLALGIDLCLNGHPLQEAPLYILDGEEVRHISITTRIGLNRGREKPLRFFATGSPFVSRAVNKEVEGVRP